MPIQNVSKVVRNLFAEKDALNDHEILEYSQLAKRMDQSREEFRKETLFKVKTFEQSFKELVCRNVEEQEKSCNCNNRKSQFIKETRLFKNDLKSIDQNLLVREEKLKSELAEICTRLNL